MKHDMFSYEQMAEGSGTFLDYPLTSFV